MAVDPPYRLDPLQNPVDVKGAPEGEGGGEPGLEDCWGLQPNLAIVPDINPTLRWGLCNVGGAAYTTNPGEAVDACEGLANGGHVDHWYVGDGNVIICFAWFWLQGIDCGWAPGPFDVPPTEPPDDWEGFNHSPNSEE